MTILVQYGYAGKQNSQNKANYRTEHLKSHKMQTMGMWNLCSYKIKENYIVFTTTISELLNIWLPVKASICVAS